MVVVANLVTIEQYKNFESIGDAESERKWSEEVMTQNSANSSEMDNTSSYGRVLFTTYFGGSK